MEPLRPGVLALAYLGIGVIGALLVLHRAERVDLGAAASASAMVVLWPLWAPFALAAPPSASVVEPPVMGRLRQLLRSEGLLDAEEAARIEDELALVGRRLAEVERRLARTAISRTSADPGERGDDPGRGIAQLHGAVRERLEARRARDLENLEALAELLELLGSELVLARCGSGEGADELVEAMWARVPCLTNDEPLLAAQRSMAPGNRKG
ncbi:MAG: hypothetical protein KC731_18290 [Myxococcales bacterium]|nr:hypothetical protein [Myxococcales bacterium]